MGDEEEGGDHDHQGKDDLCHRHPLTNILFKQSKHNFFKMMVNCCFLRMWSERFNASLFLR